MDSELEGKYNQFMEELASNNVLIVKSINDNNLMICEQITNLMSFVDIKMNSTSEIISKQEDIRKTLTEDLKTHQFDATNYNKVSVLKNQDKQIHELTIKVNELESKNKLLQDKLDSFEQSKTPIKGKGKEKSSRKSKDVVPKSRGKNKVVEPEPEPEPYNVVDAVVETENVETVVDNVVEPEPEPDNVVETVV